MSKPSPEECELLQARLTSHLSLGNIDRWNKHQQLLKEVIKLLEELKNE